MADVFEYLKWRGDIPFSQVPPTPIDGLIFSALAYVRFGDIVPGTPSQQVPLAQAAQALLSDPDASGRVRCPKDLDLLRETASSVRFGSVGMCCYQDVFLPEADTQFAAVTFLTDDNSAFLAFRGTDNTLVGWKEDFGMTFRESIPAQRLAQEYTLTFSNASALPLRLGGHSKGGNLAVYAAATSSSAVHARILEILNFDGPGFTEHMLSTRGYRNIVPRIRTYIPQSSVFGLLLEHEESHVIIQSAQVGLMQHDPYSWEVQGGGFVPAADFTPDSRFLARTFKTWLAGMDSQERSDFFNTLFDLLMVEDTNRPRDIMRPQNLRTYFRSLRTDESTRHIIASELVNLLHSARQAQLGQSDQDNPSE